MANKKFPKVGDRVKIVNCKRAEKYKNQIMEVTKSSFVFDRDIVAELKGVKAYVPARNLEIINA